MLRSTNSAPVPLNGVVSCLLYTSVVVGTARELRLLNRRMPLFFGIKYGHKKLWIALFDSKRRLLGRVVRFVSRLQLPIDCDMKWFGKRRFAEFSNRGCCPIGNGSPCLPPI
jgi:hypothetical protein